MYEYVFHTCHSVVMTAQWPVVADFTYVLVYEV